MRKFHLFLAAVGVSLILAGCGTLNVETKTTPSTPVIEKKTIIEKPTIIEKKEVIEKKS